MFFFWKQLIFNSQQHIFLWWIPCQNCIKWQWSKNFWIEWRYFEFIWFDRSHQWTIFTIQMKSNYVTFKIKFPQKCKFDADLAWYRRFAVVFFSVSNFPIFENQFIQKRWLSTVFLFSQRILYAIAILLLQLQLFNSFNSFSCVFY